MNKQAVKTLMVEDNPLDVEVLSGCLAGSDYFNYSVTPARNMAEARLLLKDQAFDLILLDLRLPNGAGVALVREVRQLAKSSALVIVTGLTNDEEEVDALRALADEYVTKNIYTDEQLRRIVRNCVIRSQARKEMAGMDAVQERMDRTLAACEVNPKLPPFAG